MRAVFESRYYTTKCLILTRYFFQCSYSGHPTFTLIFFVFSLQDTGVFAHLNQPTVFSLASFTALNRSTLATVSSRRKIGFISQQISRISPIYCTVQNHIFQHCKLDRKINRKLSLACYFQIELLNAITIKFIKQLRKNSLSYRTIFIFCYRTLFIRNESIVFLNTDASETS